MKIIVAVFIWMSLSAQAQDFLVEENPKGWIRDRLAAMDIDFDVEIFDQDFFDSLGLSLEYAYAVESSYKDGFFSRIDKFKTEAKFKPGDLISGFDSPLYMNLNKDSEIVFVRQFKKKWEAVKAKPYTPLRLPYNAKQAVEKLVPGDFVAIPSTMSFITGASFGWGINDVAEADAGLYFLMQGQFLIHVFRLQDDKVRLKLFATGLRETGARGKFETDLEIFGIQLVDGLIKRITQFDLFEFNAGLGRGGQLFLDYVFDLKDPLARKAYDKILSSRNTFKDLSLVMDSIRGTNIADRFHSTYIMAETIAREDANKPNKRVEQVFKGVNEFKKSFRNIKIGIPLLKYETEKLYARNNLIHENANGDKTKYFFPFAAKGRMKKYLWGPIKTEEEYRRTLFGLAETDYERNIVPYELGLSTDYADDKFNENEQRKFMKYFKFMVPKPIRDKIKWGRWAEGELIRDVKLYFQITLQSEAIEDIKKISWPKFKEKFLAYYAMLKHIEDEELNDKFFTKMRMKMFAKKLYKNLQKTNGQAKESLEQIFELRNRSLFYKYGIGFFLNMIPEQHLDRFVSVKLNLTAPKLPGISFKYGGVAGDRLYQQLRSILAILDNRTYDLQLTTTADHFDFIKNQ